MGSDARRLSQFDRGSTDPPRQRGALLLLALTIPHFAVTMAGQAPGLLAPWIIDGLDLTRAQLGFLTSSRFLGSSLMFLASGALVARWGISSGLMFGLLSFGLATAVAAAGQSLWWLLVLLFIAGAGFALVHPATTAGIVRGFPVAKRGTMMGLKETGVPVAGVVAPWLLPMIALAAGWRLAFAFTGLVAVVSAALVYVLLQPAPWAHSKIRIRSEAQGKSMPFTVPVVGTGLLQLLLLGLQFCVLTYLLLYLLDSANLALPVALIVVASTQVGSFTWRLFLGVVTDRVFGGRNDVVVGLIFLSNAVTVILLTFITAQTSMWALLLLGVMLGGATQGWPGPLLLLRSSLAKNSEAVPEVTAIGFSIGAWGAVIGPPLFGFAVDRTGSYDVAWTAAGLLFAAVGVCLLVIARYRPPVRSQRSSS